MSLTRDAALLAGLMAILGSPACGVSKDGNLTIGLIARAASNPVTIVVRKGAEQAAIDLGKQYGIKIRIENATPPKDDPTLQVAAIEKLVLDGVDGFTIDCADTAEVGAAIDDAVQSGLLVATFASDAPASKRFFCYSTDNEQCGQTLMIQLATLLKGKGTIAVLGGKPTAENLKRRVAGIKAAAQLYPGISIRGVYYCDQTTAGAELRVNQVMRENPDLNGWAMVGSWALSDKKAFPWPPGKIRCVSMGVLPNQLAYIRDHHVDSVVAQPYFDWGYRTVERIVLQAGLNRRPPEQIEYAPIEIVNASNLSSYGKIISNWLTDKDEAASQSEYVVPRPP